MAEVGCRLRRRDNKFLFVLVLICFNCLILDRHLPRLQRPPTTTSLTTTSTCYRQCHFLRRRNELEDSMSMRERRRERDFSVNGMEKETTFLGLFNFLINLDAARSNDSQHVKYRPGPWCKGTNLLPSSACHTWSVRKLGNSKCSFFP